jgi:hypothetical protein
MIAGHLLFQYSPLLQSLLTTLVYAVKKFDIAYAELTSKQPVMIVVNVIAKCLTDTAHHVP